MLAKGMGHPEIGNIVKAQSRPFFIMLLPEGSDADDMAEQLLEAGTAGLLEDTLGVGSDAADELLQHTSTSEAGSGSGGDKGSGSAPPPGSAAGATNGAPKHDVGSSAATSDTAGQSRGATTESQTRQKLGALLRASRSSFRGSRTSLLRASHASLGTSLGTSLHRGSRLSSFRGSSTTMNQSLDLSATGEREVIRTVEIGDGPLGITISNDSRGFTTVLTSSGQAEEQGIVAGDIIFAIGDTVLARGIAHKEVGRIIMAESRPFLIMLLPAGTDADDMAARLVDAATEGLLEEALGIESDEADRLRQHVSFSTTGTSEPTAVAVTPLPERDVGTAESLAAPKSGRESPASERGAESATPFTPSPAVDSNSADLDDDGGSEAAQAAPKDEVRSAVKRASAVKALQRSRDVSRRNTNKSDRDKRAQKSAAAAGALHQMLRFLADAGLGGHAATFEEFGFR